MNPYPNPSNYIPRRLQPWQIAKVPEDWTNAAGVFVLVGEPGSGKTSFVDGIARLRGSTKVRAKRALNQLPTSSDIIIDGLDEVAFRDQAQLEKLFDELGGANRSFMLFATRSSCWTSELSQYCSESFGQAPIVFSLLPFNFEEQHQLYLMLKPNGNFEEFRRSMYRIGLGPLLGNPQLLKLLIGANEQGEFRTKSEAFELASQKAVQFEANGRDGVTPEKKQEAANEIFAKLLLSNTAAVLTRQTDSDGTFRTEYPRVESLLKNTNLNAREVLETALLRPGAEVNSHEPIHRTVAEHGAATYLAARLNNPETHYH